MVNLRFITLSVILFCFVSTIEIDAFNLEQVRLLLELSCGTMQNADLSGADLSGADLSGRSFKNINFTKAILNGANCNNTIFIGCVFTNAIICNAQFNNSQIRWTTFKDAVIQNSIFDRSVIVNGNFRRADLRETSFQNSSLTGEKGRKIGFSGSRLNSTNFNGSTIRDAHFRNAIIDRTTIFANAHITNVCFKKTCLDGVEFKVQELRERRVYDEEPLCPICREDYQRGRELGILPCGHRFCNECISSWLKRINSCPVCRYAPIMGYQRLVFG